MPPVDAEEMAGAKEIEFLEALHRRIPHHAPLLETLGHYYTSVGRLEQGREADEALVRLEPNSPLAWYNLACSLALTRQPDAAIRALQKAATLGYSDAEWMLDDDDLASLRTDPRFILLAKSMQTTAP